MSIEVRCIDNRWCPIVNCDGCGQIIDDGGNGAFWMSLDPGDSALYFTHYGRCLDLLKAQLEKLHSTDPDPHGVFGWQSLDVLMYQFLENVHITPDKAAADFMARLIS